MAHGFKSGGRKPGSKNKKTSELKAEQERLVERVSEMIGEPFEGDAHALLVLIYKDQTRDISLRLDAAKAAIRFEKPALGAVETGPEVLERYVARVPVKSENTEAWQQQHGLPTIQ
jgi:hypothetical protein